MSAIASAQENNTRVYLVDGSGYIFRAFYAVQPLTTKDGFPTNALFGFTRMLLKLLTASDSQHVVVVFDAGRDTFRKEMYEDYKAHRKETPEELVKQLPYFKEIAAALGLPVYELQGYEADDIIGTFADRFTKAGIETVVVTGDKDLMQLVDERVSIWDTLKDKHYYRKEVEEKFGVPPEKVVEFLGIAGDSSDNVPGLSGAGPKTALQLIQKFGDIETILKSVEAIRADPEIRNRKKLAETIEADPEILKTSRKLVEIDRHTPVKIAHNGGTAVIQDLSDEEVLGYSLRKPHDKDKLGELLHRFEFISLAKELDVVLRLPIEPKDKIKVEVIDARRFKSWAKELSALPEFAFDVETTSLDVRAAKIVGASFSNDAQSAVYVPIGHVSPGSFEQVAAEEFFSTLKPIFESEKIKKCGQNLKYDISILAEQGIEVRGTAFDSMLASYCLNPDRGSHGLTALASEYLGERVIEYDDLVGEAPDFSHVAIDKAAEYAGQDANFAWRLKEVLGKKIAEEGLGEVFDKIEVPLISVLSRMERRGVLIDAALLGKMSGELSVKCEDLQKKIYEAAGTEFNMNSPKQLSEILFVKLGIPTKGLKKTKTGISTDSSVLERLAHQHPLPGLILDYRGLFKLKSTYVDALPAQISAYTGRLHAKFNQAVTGTGRLSSSDPNLQNIPIQTAEGRRIRTAFIADEGRSIISADYSQIELRLLAHLSKDKTLIAAFREGRDIHEATAREILRIPPLLEVTSEQRRIGKTINFGLIYGMGPYRLARELGIPNALAEEYIDEYFARYAGVKEFFAAMEHKANTEGVVATLFGRKRYIASIDASGRDQGFVLRAALNAPIQGTAADLVKIAMIAIDAKAESEAPGLSMIMQIHDELVFECPEPLVEAAVKLIRREMEGAASLLVPLKVDVGVGSNWEEAHN